MSNQAAAIPRPVNSALDSLLPAERRSFLEFCEAEVVLPDGPRKGHYFSCDYMPFTRILLTEADNPRWKRQFWAGPSQGAKTFLGTVCRLLYRLAECRRDVAAGAPTVEMFVNNIWAPKVMPVVDACKERGRLLRFLPKSGRGSRGGAFITMLTGYGSRLFILGGGGGDSQRISVTVEDIIVTELDQLGDVKEASKEGTPIDQMEARLGAYEGTGHARTYGECVVHGKRDLIWHEVHVIGSGGRIYIWCPHCEGWLYPERKYFTGWQDADSVHQAERRAAYVCQHCGVAWSEADRAAANARPRLVHRGQKVNKRGQVIGEVPDTDTLGIQWNAMHLHADIRSMANIAAAEWRAGKAETDEKRRAVLWRYWAEPYVPEDEPAEEITSDYVRKRTGNYVRSMLPSSGGAVLLYIDLGKHACHWVLRQYVKTPDDDGADTLGPIATCDMGVIEVHQGERDEGVAILSALRDFRDTRVAEGWVDADGHTRLPDRVLVDSGDWSDIVYKFCRESGPKVYIPTKGYGSDYNRSPFKTPTSNKRGKVRPGNHWAFYWQTDARVWLLAIDADHWKKVEHARWMTAAGAPTSLSLFTPSDKMDARDIHSYSRHIVAEREQLVTIKTKAGKQEVRKWVVRSKNNHKLDCSAGCNVGADLLGYRPLESGPVRKARSSTGRGGKTLQEMLGKS